MGKVVSGFIAEGSGMLQLSAKDLNDINGMRAPKGKLICASFTQPFSLSTLHTVGED